MSETLAIERPPDADADLISIAPWPSSSVSTRKRLPVARSGQFPPAVHIGRQWRVPKPRLERFCMARRHEGRTRRRPGRSRRRHPGLDNPGRSYHHVLAPQGARG